jgi:two-component system, chemotaxis family, sensor kinase CheA
MGMENVRFEDEEMVHEFVVESRENLERLDRDLVELEKHPHDSALLSSVFRTFHTIKGSCGFLAYSHLEQISHQAENLLSQLRDGKRELDPNLVSLILETVDAIRRVLASIETTGQEGDVRFEDLIGRLRQTAQSPSQPVSIPPQLEKGREPEKILESEKGPEAEKAQAAVLATDSNVTAAGRAESNNSPSGTPPKETIVPFSAPFPAIGKKETSETDLAEASVKELIGPLPANGKKEAYEHPMQVQSDDESVRSSTATDTNIRVGVGLLDKLMDLVGELVLTRNQVLQANLESADSALNTSSQRLNLITTELQENVMKTRMQPIRVVWGNLPRVVRDMAVSLKKQIELKMDGADTELDRTLIEAIKDPLIHLVRNACDHGIETPEIRIAAGKPAQGTMTLRAYHEGGQVTIEVGDDGAGIDIARVKQKAVQNGLMRSEDAEDLSEREALNLIFLPGLSTAKSVTKISGRGVGMDVVKSQIEKIGGITDIFTRLGEGTTVKIRIPLTLAIIPGLVVTCRGERFLIPQVSLLELIQLDEENGGKHVEYLHGAPVFRRRGSLLPVAYLNEVLGMQPAEGHVGKSMVVLQTEERQFGLIVDSINDTQEIVVKPLGKQLKGVTLYAGATIMGDGNIALILDVLGIGQYSGVFGEVREGSGGAKDSVSDSEQRKQRFLLVKSGSFERIAIPLSLVARLEEFPRAAIEKAGGGHVMQYRDRILPLVVLRSVLEPSAPADFESLDPVPVVVFNEGDQSIGVVVDQIVDVTEESVTVRQETHRKGLLGSAVIGKYVTDFLDLGAVLEASKENWRHSNRNTRQTQTLLVAGKSSFSRGLMRGMLEMSGYAVLEAGEGENVIGPVGSGDVDAVVAFVGQQRDLEISRFIANLGRSVPDAVPVLAVVDSLNDECAAKLRASGVNDCREILDREGILEALEKMLASTDLPSVHSECAAEVA